MPSKAQMRASIVLDFDEMWVQTSFIQGMATAIKVPTNGKRQQQR
jgi:hypothetical protein